MYRRIEAKRKSNNVNTVCVKKYRNYKISGERARNIE